MTASVPVEPLVSTAVLAGGQSRRMGRDKASLVPTDQPSSLLGMVAGVLGAISDDVLVIGGTPEQGVPPATRSVPDEPGHAGPLRGIAAALRAARHDWCLVVACDLPFLSPDLLRWLCVERTGVDAVVPLTRASGREAHGRPQPLHAVYHRRCLPVALDLLASTGRAGALLERVSVSFVEEDELRRFDPTLRSLTNLNTPKDLATAFGAQADAGAVAAPHRLYSTGDPRSGEREP